MREISRRDVLRGLGATIALPLLDAMLPRSLLRAATAAEGVATPVRTAFVFVPNGMIMPKFKPAKVGPEYDLPPTLAPLESRKKDLLVLSGLALDNGRAKGDGPGDHARASASFLTCAHPKKTSGKDIYLGISVDQVMARAIGKETVLPSLELGCDRGVLAGRCDSGYSCAYVSNVSWSGPTTPSPKEANPRLVFERLFGSEKDRKNAEARARRLKRRKSVLDYVAEDAKRLNKKLGTGDREKLDEFTTSLREVERRIQRAETEKSDRPKPTMKAPSGAPDSYQAHVRLMYDLMTLTFQTDATRVVSFMVANAGSNRSYAPIGVPQGHHHISHHKGDVKKIAMLEKIDLFHMQEFARFLDGLAATKEGETNLLDGSQILLGSGLGDSNRHWHHDLPVILAGRAGGKIEPGRHLAYAKNTPLANLYVTMLGQAGASATEFGDSTGALPL